MVQRHSAIDLKSFSTAAQLTVTEALKNYKLQVNVILSREDLQQCETHVAVYRPFHKGNLTYHEHRIE